jgi:hypothetical protein
MDEWATGPEWPQVLLRAAAVYRLATRGHREVRASTQVGGDGYVAEEGRLLRLIEGRL